MWESIEWVAFKRADDETVWVSAMAVLYAVNGADLCCPVLSDLVSLVESSRERGLSGQSG